jgi:transposase
MRILMMNKSRRGRGSKYTDDFKRQLVAESRTAGVSVPMVAKKHGVGTNRIYAWRSDGRFQPDKSDIGQFTPVEISACDTEDAPFPSVTTLSDGPRIEITLENGRKLSVSDGVDAGFVLELARGLAA